MRTLYFLPLGFLPTTAFAHAGHAAGTGHDLWIIGAAVAAAAIFGLTRKA